MLTVIVIITGICSLYVITVLTVIVTITGSICSVNSYCENNGDIYVVLTVIVTITGRSICSVNSYCDNNGDLYVVLYCNGDIYMQC